MKTINELGIYFMCCFIFATLFITYLAVKLRAYRIKNASLTNRIEIAYKDITDAYESIDKVNLELKKSYLEQDESKRLLEIYKESFIASEKTIQSFRTESAAIINQSAENNAKLVKEVEHLKDKLEWILQDNSATSLALEVAKSDLQKLFDRVEELKRDKRILYSMAKGATAKLAEMNVALEGLEVKEEKVREFKVGDYIKGNGWFTGKPTEGTIVGFAKDGRPRIDNTKFLELSTCKRVSKTKNL